MTINLYITLIRFYLGPWLNDHLTVLGKLIAINKSVILIFIIIALLSVIITDTGFLTIGHLSIFIIGTIYIADIAATKHVTVAFGNTSQCTNLATIDVYLGLSEDKAIAVERAVCTQVVIASTTTEHVAVHIAFIHFDNGLTSLVDGGSTINHHCTTHGSNLTASEDAVANLTTIHRHVGNIDTTVINITTPIETARL